MYVKKELTKTIIAAVIGIILGVIFITSNTSFEGGEKVFLMFISPFYGIGLVYGWRSIWGGLMKVLGIGVKGSFFSALFKSLTSFFITIILVIIGIGLVIMFVWIIGVVNCIRSFSTAYNSDKNSLGA